ncbi:hypothetical protein ACQP2K_12585 [Microbispora siamensis]
MPRTRPRYARSVASAAMPRSTLCQTWRWVSTKPGSTMPPAASMISTTTAASGTTCGRGSVSTTVPLTMIVLLMRQRDRVDEMIEGWRAELTA